jgi:hypothetical protein
MQTDGLAGQQRPNGSGRAALTGASAGICRYPASPNDETSEAGIEAEAERAYCIAVARGYYGAASLEDVRQHHAQLQCALPSIGVPH